MVIKFSLGWALLPLAFAMGIVANHVWSQPKFETQIVKDTQQVRVEVPVLTERVVDKIVKDPTERALLDALLKENRELKIKVTQLTSTVVQNQVQGGGIVLPVQPTSPGGASGAVEAQAYRYEDFQLKAQWTGPDFRYWLDQKFSVTTSTGKDSSGKPTSIIEVFQLTPDGPKPMKVVSSFAMFATPNPSKWMVSPRIQGGITSDRKGVVAFQWLKRGASKDPKDLKVALLSPGLTITKGSLDPIVAPISFNLGSLPKQPFSNIWVSLTVGTGLKLGVSLTATF